MSYDPPSQPDQPQYPYQPPGTSPPPQYPYPQQPNTQYPPQQPDPPAQPPKKKRGPLLWILLIVGIIIVIGILIGIAQFTSHPSASTLSEPDYKASTTDTTISSLDKNGSDWKDKDVHFTCTILNFVKDSNGNTAGANVDDPNSSGVVQIAFPQNTDLSQLNTGDTLEVWGTDGGTSSGQNAFGATVQEVVVVALYMNDQTTGYQDNG